MEDNRIFLLRYLFRQLKSGSEKAKEFTYQNNHKLELRTVYSQLKREIDNFINGEVENRFIVMTGLRGVGKTTLIFQLYNYLFEEKKINNDRILYLSLDDLTSFGENIRNAIDVFIYDIHQRSPTTLDEELFIFIDEAQYDKNWSLSGKIIFDSSKKIFMIFTGSSALELEMNVDAARRTKKEYVYPLSFKEYLSLKYKIQTPNEISYELRNLILKGESEKIEKME
ncbi:MAG: AAA family ATPase, partial [Methanobrevibacter sp.]|nr:AAA family ATPase [Methanobrevibacter sp.]